MEEISPVLDPLQFILKLQVIVAGSRLGNDLFLDCLGFQETFNFLKDLNKSDVVVNELN